MTPMQKELLARIERFSFDEPGTAFTFAQRLARENGWAAEYTRRVLREYGRFTFLAMEAGHAVCPSEEVDQTWHQHLTFTQNYWEDFCGRVLGRPLHHGPTRGGRTEAVKHHDMYARTLASYREFFGEEAPADIWPPTERRFGDGGSFVRVNRREVWIVPKPRWLRAAALFAIGLAAMLFVAAKPAALPPGEIPIFDLPGPEFLGFFLAAIVVASIAALAIRSGVRGEGRFYGSRREPSDPYVIATLTGGPKLAV